MYKKNLSNDQSTSLDLKKQFVKGLDISDFFETIDN